MGSSEELGLIVVLHAEDVVAGHAGEGAWEEIIDEVSWHLVFNEVVFVLLRWPHVGLEVWHELSAILNDVEEWVLEDLTVLSVVGLIVEQVDLSITGNVHVKLVVAVWSQPLDWLDVWGNVHWLDLDVSVHGVVLANGHGNTLSGVWVEVDTIWLSSCSLWAWGLVLAVVESTETEISFSEVNGLEPWGITEGSWAIDHPALAGWLGNGPPVLSTIFAESEAEEGSEDEEFVHLNEKFVFRILIIIFLMRYLIYWNILLGY